jgi:hypothetical protein
VRLQYVYGVLCRVRLQYVYGVLCRVRLQYVYGVLCRVRLQYVYGALCRVSLCTVHRTPTTKDLTYYAATSPNSPRRPILTDCLNNYNFS